MKNKVKKYDNRPLAVVNSDGYVVRQSKSQKKREAHQLQELGEALVSKATDSQKLMLPEDLQEAINDAREINAHGGRRRQIQLIGRLIRQWQEQDFDAVGALLHWQNDLHHKKARQAKIAAAIIRWTNNLLKGGPALQSGNSSAILQRFAMLYPDAPLAQLTDQIIIGQKHNLEGKIARRNLSDTVNAVLNQH